MLKGEHLDAGSFFARKLYNAATSTKGRIVVGGIITSITRFLGIEPNPNDRVSGCERLDKAAFELMAFFGRLRQVGYIGYTLEVG